MIGRMRRIYPAAGEDLDDLDALYGGPRPVPGDRPWVGLTMIASLDGSTAVDGRSGGLGNDNDQAVFRAVRRSADVILVGARTAVSERYGAAARAGQRIGVVTGSGRVDIDTDLFSSGCGFLVIPEDGPSPPDGVDVVRAGHGAVDLVRRLRRLADVAAPVRFVQAEGGPRLNGGLLDGGCVDELDLSLSPMLAGGAGSRLVDGSQRVAAALPARPRPRRRRRLPVHSLDPSRRAGRVGAMPLSWSGALGAELAEQLDLAVEVGGGVEVLVHAGEAQVGDLVDGAELVEHEQPDVGARRLGAGEADRILDRFGDLVDLWRH